MTRISKTCLISTVAVIIIFSSFAWTGRNTLNSARNLVIEIFSQKENQFANSGESRPNDFRVIVITFNRPSSLQKLLTTIDEIELDGDQGCLEIWIDRDKQNRVHNETVQVAKSFQWKKGPTSVHIQKEHVGIYGQWIDTWKPDSDDTTEIALILEDDLIVSKFTYRWLKAVHKFYGPKKDFAGASLQSDEVLSHDGKSRPLKAPPSEPVFYYKCIGTWGFSPKASIWRAFQNWYHIHILKPDFHPYVPNIITTEWYKSFEKRGTADSMWEQWFIYYAYKEKLYSLYSNLNEYNHDRKSCLSVNRREIGLHYHQKGDENRCKLLSVWKTDFTRFSSSVTKLDWNGRPTPAY